MSQQTQRLWRRPPDQLGTLRDLGSVDVSIQVAVSAGNDERQTPVILLTLNTTQWRTLTRVLDRERLTPFLLGSVTYDGHLEYVLTMQMDDCSNLAGILDDTGNWSDTVTALRKALGLAGCWVELQAGP